MMTKLRAWFLAFVQYWVVFMTARFLEPKPDQLQADRLAAVQTFVLGALPKLIVGSDVALPTQLGRVECNYFELPSGEFPAFDFVLPTLGLYICVPGIVSAPWQEARLWGVKRLEWEAAQSNLQSLQQMMSEVYTEGDAPRPRLLIIDWETPTNYVKLATAVREALEIG